MKNYRFSLQVKFLVGIGLIVIPTLAIIFVWAGIQYKQQSITQKMNQARTLARQVILTRQWVADSRGVLVHRGSEGAKDITYFYDHRIDTPDGTYQRFTPSMVTRKLSQYSLQQARYHFRLTALNPLNPLNKPDPFEEIALKRFDGGGVSETYNLETRDSKNYLHYMVPLFVDDACLNCHKEQGFSKGSVGGGLSIHLPMDDTELSLRKYYFKLAASGASLLFLTMITLFVLMRQIVIKPSKELERMTAEISQGNLEARVDINTGDEFEKLGQASNLMAERLSEGREVLEAKISEATQELLEANRELQTLDKLKSDFLANMSHELRSPLTSIRGGVDYLNRTIKGEENRNYLAIIDKNLSRLIHLVSDLFDFTKIEAKKVDWSFEEENVSDLIEEVIEIVSPLAENKRVSVWYEHPGDIFAEIDIERIVQVLVNLIDNAIKFSPAFTRIEIRINDAKDRVTAAVKDQGVGIPEEHLEFIFEKFQTLPAEKEGKTEGAGLGLAICKGIVEGHGGEIWAESVKGEGSTFFFSLPKVR
jgi:signal transduction histidine kinase